MSTGQWEVVGKGKKAQNGKVKNNNEDKKPAKNLPKPDDVGIGKFNKLCSSFFGIFYCMPYIFYWF